MSRISVPDIDQKTRPIAQARSQTHKAARGVPNIIAALVLTALVLSAAMSLGPLQGGH